MWREMIVGSNYNNRSNFFGSPKKSTNRGSRGSPRRDRRGPGGVRESREEEDEYDLPGGGGTTPLRSDVSEKDKKPTVPSYLCYAFIHHIQLYLNILVPMTFYPLSHFLSLSHLLFITPSNPLYPPSHPGPSSL